MTVSRLLLPVMSALLLVTGASAFAADAAGDAALADAVKAKLVEKDPEFLRAGTIEVSGGIVTLKGHVYTPTALATALVVSGQVPGVVRVINHTLMR
jgi:osmotically-inducible protein OsmY